MSKQIFRVKLTHRPHYVGFTACVFHALEMKRVGAVEITEVEPAKLPLLPDYQLAAGLGHCRLCNCEKKGIPNYGEPKVTVG